ncbi:DUF4395 family protein [Gracilibacillus sp. YIM 98692]|uniref:DUF4395 family protein n=1 Tax=Gracilibacillus sp. YIM 98692 TaxID=2663532 RepID=UPI0023E3BC48|nr:DUF4395 family protein [Gracilibacillus sp. YIM 98692]
MKWGFLFIPLIIGLYTILTKNNPIIRVGKHFLRKPTYQYPPEDKAQQLFNQWIATICISLSIVFFTIEISWAGYLFSLMVVLASASALLGYCIGCTIRYRYMMWKHQRTKA